MEFESWNEKYCPRKLSDLVGQPKAVMEVTNFISKFPSTRKKAILLWGPTGCGKTCLIKALASEKDCELVELSGADLRNKDAVGSILGAASKQMSLFGGSKIILVDEVDSMSGVRDRGGLPALIEVIKNTQFPIILTANDAYIQKLKTLRNYCVIVDLKKLMPLSIAKRLGNICNAESIDYEDNALRKLTLSVDGDMRAAINDLQMLCHGKDKLTEQDVKVWSRESEESIFNALKLIFKSYDLSAAFNAVDSLSEDYTDVMWWIDENLPSEYGDNLARSRAYNCLAHADIFNRRIMRWQHWRFLVYVRSLLVAGVQHAKEYTSARFIKYQRPSILLKLYIRAAKRRKSRGITKQVGSILHASSRNLEKSFYPFYEFIQKNNPKYAEEIDEWLGL
jgi:replication factor C large subunit